MRALRSRSRSPIAALPLAGAAAVALGIAFSVACSDGAPTAPGKRTGATAGAVSDAPLAGRARRPTPRTIGPRGGGGATLPIGVWGGDQAELTTTSAGATLRLFCAHGVVSQPIEVDRDGRFSTPGWLVREGGPVPIDDTPFRRPALYSGSTDGTTTITFFVAVEGEAAPRGPFTVVLGRKTSLGFCPIV